MVLIDGVKWSCSACIKGHRSSHCKHADRQLFEIQKKGRPAFKCKVCKGKAGSCACQTGETTPAVETPPVEPLAKRQKGRNSKAHLAIERAKAKGAVICTCGEKGTCVCPPGHGPCCQTASKVASSSAVRLDDICCLPPPLLNQPLPNVMIDVGGSEPASGCHHQALVEVPSFVEVPSMENPMPGSSCCRSKAIDQALIAVPPLSPVFDVPVDRPMFDLPLPSPPGYHQTSEQGFSFSLNELSQAASCAGPCRPQAADLDPFLADLFAGYNSAQSSSGDALSALVASQTPSGCSCSAGKAEAVSQNVDVDACTTCGPACGCGKGCRCGNMALLQFPLDYDVDALLKELLGPAAGFEPSNDTKEVSGSVQEASTIAPAALEEKATSAPAVSSCCCAK